jgi:hypothetical protein
LSAGTPPRLARHEDDLAIGDEKLILPSEPAVPRTAIVHNVIDRADVGETETRGWRRPRKDRFFNELVFGEVEGLFTAGSIDNIAPDEKWTGRKLDKLIVPLGKVRRQLLLYGIPRTVIFG